VGTDTEVRQVFDPASIATLGNVVRRRWVEVPEWGGASVCLWGTTFADAARIEGDVALEEANLARFQRRCIATIIECARDGDGPEAKPVFERTAHWGWLEKQPNSVLLRLYNVVSELDAIDGVTGEQIASFFETVGSLKACLTHIASHCDACTDCPANSRPECPRQLLPSLYKPTESSANTSTDTSATAA
jgi:hypothetical protein